MVALRIYLYNIAMKNPQKMTLPQFPEELSHHAYLLIGNKEFSSLIEYLKSKIAIHGNPDFFERSYASLGIDDAREIKTLAGTRPILEGGKKIFVLQVNAITVEAQNALLKLLEEPPAYAHFFIIVPSAHLLLPTVKSRMS